MKVIWTANVQSPTRRDKRTGQPIEYRLTVFDTGEASCSCPAFIFQSVNNPLVAPEDKLRYRCKHLTQAFAVNDFEGMKSASTPAPEPTPERVKAAPPVNPHGIWLDDDTPRTRR